MFSTVSTNEQWHFEGYLLSLYMHIQVTLLASSMITARVRAFEFSARG
jgi:hypothetical protein